MKASSYNLQQDLLAVKQGLVNQLPSLLTYLFSDKRIQRLRHEYRVGNHGSIALRIADGSYYNHETGEGGDLITLIQHILKTDFKGALLFAKNFLGSPSNIIFPSLPKSERKISERIRRQSEKALGMIKSSEPIKGTIAEVYLSKHRNITLIGGNV